MSYTTTVLNKAQAALDAGNKAEARNIVKPVVEAEPSNARAWYLLADATEDEEQRFYYKTRGDQARTAMETAPAVPQVAPVARVAPPSFPPIVEQRAKIQLASEIAACERRIASAQSEISLSKRRLASFLPALLFAGGAFVVGIGMLILSGHPGQNVIGGVLVVFGGIVFAILSGQEKRLKQTIATAEQELKSLRQQLNKLQN